MLNVRVLKLGAINWEWIFLLLLFLKLLRSWLPACKATRRRLRDGARRVWRVPCECLSLPPDRPRHTLSSYLPLHTPHCVASSSATEGKRKGLVCFRMYSVFPRPDHSLLWNHHLSESHSSGPSSVFSSVKQPIERRLLRNATQSLLQYFTKDLPFALVRSLTQQRNLSEPIKPSQSKYSESISQQGFICMHLWIRSSINVYWLPGITLYHWDTSMNKTNIFRASRSLDANGDMQTKQNRKYNIIVY